jgi:uncharacterized protein YbjQ (UPF0145 family)
MNPVTFSPAQRGPGSAAAAPVPPARPGAELTVDPRFVTTAFELPGYRITSNLGLVRGIVVRSRSIVGNLFAGIQTLFGGNITIYTNLCEKAREDAFRLMMEQAEEVGANAIIGVRYDANEVTSGVTEVLAYGTAVVAEKVDKGTPLDN